jgi:hypothetical protein
MKGRRIQAVVRPLRANEVLGAVCYRFGLDSLALVVSKKEGDGFS